MVVVVIVVVVVVIPVGGISSLLRRKAVFFSQSRKSRYSLPHFHLPRPSPFLCSYEKKKETVVFGALENGVERNVKKR